MSDFHAPAKPLPSRLKTLAGWIETSAQRFARWLRTLSTKSEPGQSQSDLSGPNWLGEARGRLKDVVQLEPGWDGHQGKPVRPEIADYAFLLLQRLVRRPGIPRPIISPLSYGGLVLEWHRKGWDVEIEIDAPRSHHIYTHHLASEAEEEFELKDNPDRLGAVVRRISD